MGTAHLPIELRTDGKQYLRDTRAELLEYKPLKKKNKKEEEEGKANNNNNNNKKSKNKTSKR